MKFAAIGRTEILYDTIELLCERKHRPAFIVTAKESPEYRRRVSDFQALAERRGIPCVVTPRIDAPEVLKLVRKEAPEIAVSINWVSTVRKEFMDSFPRGIVNAHAGDLPRYRGNAVPNWAILAGEKQIALTVHQMDPGLDSGPVLLKRTLPLSETTYVGEIYDRMRADFPQMFAEAVDGLESGSIVPRPQTGRPLRCYPRIPDDSELDWRQEAVQICRLVRASSEPFPGAYTHLNLEKLIIWRAHPELFPHDVMGTPGQVAERRPSGEVSVVTGQGFLVLEEVETAKQGRCRPAEAILSARDRLGLTVSQVLRRLETLGQRRRRKDRT